MFLFGNMRTAGLADQGEPYQGTYAAAFAGGEIIGVVAHYWNHNLVFQAPVLVKELLRRAVEASGRDIGGLIGPGGQVDTAKEALDVDEYRIRLDEMEKLYALELDDLLVPDALASGQVVGRRAGLEDLELLIAWRVAYGAEALGEEETVESRERARSVVQRPVKEKRTWVLEAGGEPVACSSFNTATQEAVQVGGVWTPPELRSQGYGRAVVAASLLDARSEGVTTAILFTGQENIPAQRAYEALGFEHCGVYRMVLLNPPLGNDRLASTHG
jgi:ribosomal protein S18 acetylase RimI-like enzyme